MATLLSHIVRDRPLVVFDIESTGTNRQVDRIIDIAFLKIEPGADQAEPWTLRLNPGIPIPPDATRIHGITDADVASAPSFAQEAPRIIAYLEGCDLGGFNVLQFDIGILTEEFRRADVPFSMAGRRVLDAQRIFHRREPRDLSAALRFYCGDEHEGAHGALADAEATLRVLAGQLQRYEDLPRDLDALDAFCRPRDPSWVDETGRLRWLGEEVVVNFGKYQGRPLRELVVAEPGFLRWILKKDFPRDTKDLVSEAIEGRYPERPKP